MKFYLVDHIQELETPDRIVAVKNLTLAEEYLADHFPSYPVLPGVLMLEALVQSAAWLVRTARDFEPTLILLKEARNVRYGTFVRPGGQLVMEVTAKEIGEETSTFKAVGRCRDATAVQARLVLEHGTVAEEEPGAEAVDDRLRTFWRERFGLIGGPQALETAAEAS